MKKYQIKEVKEIYNHAGSKAVEDVCNFAKEAGYEPLYIRQRKKDTGMITLMINQFGFFADWFKALSKAEKNSVILLQNPFKRKHLGRFFLLRLFKRLKGFKLVSVIHDVEELRLSYYREFSTKEFNFMQNNSDYFIVHNKAMKEYFLERGFEPESLIELGIFDYGYESDKKIKKDEAKRADVVVAGNLEKQKCPYIYKLYKLDNPVKINLYGVNFEGDKKKSEYVNYCGAFPSEKIPAIMNGRFGLVWDGDSTDECNGDTGNYLRYNNPHKTSLYLVAGIPVIIWEKAALADFIVENKLGITVGSLEEIKDRLSNISEDEYNEMKTNVAMMSTMLRQGYHIKNALKECEARISNAR